MQSRGVRSSRADLRVQIESLHQLYNSTNEEVFSRLGLLSPSSKPPNPYHGVHPTSPLVTAAALMENNESPDLQRHYVPRPTGNLFFYRPQNECNTPKEQAQLAAGPLSTPDSPSMVCSGASGIEEDEQDDGWSRHRPEHEQQHEQQQQIVDAVQHKTKEHTFSQDFANFVIPPSLNNTSRQAVKKDTAALDMILKKAAVFLSPLPATKDKESDEEREEEDVVAGSEGVVGSKEVKEKILPIIPRCLAFDEDARSIEKEEERTREPQQPQRHADELQRPKAQPAVSATVSNNNNSSSSSALHRLKQKTLERQSSQVAALSKLKQLTALKQKNRIASSSIRPQSALPDGYTTSTTTSASIGEEVSCFKTPMVVSLQKNVPAASIPTAAGDIKRAGPLASAAYTTENRPQGTSDDVGTTATGKKPYLKRRSVAIPMQHQGIPDWSGVKPKTQSKLESNLISNRQKSGTTTSHSSNASVSRQGHQQQAPREYTSVPGGGSETMEQYTAALYNQQNSTNSTRGGSGTAQKVPAPSTGSKRDPWRSIRPSTQSATGPLGQSKPSTLSSASTAHRHHHQQQHIIHPHQHRVEMQATPSFNPNSIVSTPASRNAFGPLGAAAIGASHAVGYYSTPSQYSHQSIAQMEDPLRPLVSQVDELLNSVGRAIRR